MNSEISTPIVGPSVVAIVPAAITSAAETGSPAKLAKKEGRLASTMLAREPGPTTLTGEGGHDPVTSATEERPGLAIIVRER